MLSISQTVRLRGSVATGVHYRRIAGRIGNRGVAMRVLSAMRVLRGAASIPGRARVARRARFVRHVRTIWRLVVAGDGEESAEQKCAPEGQRGHHTAR